MSQILNNEIQNKIIFFSDIDGTLIAKPNGNEIINENDYKIVSITNDGISYIKKKNINELSKLKQRIVIIPITGRGIECYNTLKLGIDFEYSLLESGAILFKNGQPEQEWLEETRDIVRKDLSLYNNAREILKKYNCKIKYNSEFMLDYFINEEYSFEEIRDSLMKSLNYNFIISSPMKGVLNITHIELEKGKNIERFKKRLKKDCFTISAGDTMADGSMFTHTDYSIGFSDIIPEPKVKYKEKSNLEFLDMIINEVKNIVEKIENDE